MADVHSRPLDSRLWSINSGKFIAGVGDQFGKYFIPTPELIAGLVGTPDSILPVGDLLSAGIQQISISPERVASEFLDTNWVARNWPDPVLDSSRFRRKLRTWILNNLNRPEFNGGNRNFNLYLVQKVIGGNNYTVPVVFLGGDGPVVEPGVNYTGVFNGHPSFYNSVNGFYPTLDDLNDQFLLSGFTITTNNSQLPALNGSNVVFASSGAAINGFYHQLINSSGTGALFDPDPLGGVVYGAASLPFNWTLNFSGRWEIRLTFTGTVFEVRDVRENEFGSRNLGNNYSIFNAVTQLE